VAGRQSASTVIMPATSSLVVTSPPVVTSPLPATFREKRGSTKRCDALRPSKVVRLSRESNAEGAAPPRTWNAPSRWTSTTPRWTSMASGRPCSRAQRKALALGAYGTAGRSATSSSKTLRYAPPGRIWTIPRRMRPRPAKADAARAPSHCWRMAPSTARAAASKVGACFNLVDSPSRSRNTTSRRDARSAEAGSIRPAAAGCHVACVGTERERVPPGRARRVPSSGGVTAAIFTTEAGKSRRSHGGSCGFPC
jgi:hypothetical protein